MLVVDEDRLYAESLARALELRRFKTSVATAADAVPPAASSDSDVVLVDMRGIDSLRALRELVASMGARVVAVGLAEGDAHLTAARRAPLLPNGITPRELQVLELIDDGLSNKEIAGRLQVELATVKNHVHNILRKLDVQRRTQAAAALRPVAADTTVLVAFVVDLF